MALIIHSGVTVAVLIACCLIPVGRRLGSLVILVVLRVVRVRVHLLNKTKKGAREGDQSA